MVSFWLKSANFEEIGNPGKNIKSGKNGKRPKCICQWTNEHKRFKWICDFQVNLKKSYFLNSRAKNTVLTFQKEFYIV